MQTLPLMQHPLIAVPSSSPLIPSLPSRPTIMVQNHASSFGILFHIFPSYLTRWLVISRFSASNLLLALRPVPRLPHALSPDNVYARLISQETVANLAPRVTLVRNAKLAPLDAPIATMASLVLEPVSRLLSQPTRLLIAIVSTELAARTEPALVTRDGLPRQTQEILPSATLVLKASSRIPLGIANDVALAAKHAPTRPVPALHATPASPSTRSRLSSAV